MSAKLIHFQPDQHDTWTCRRCFDGVLVQIDFIIGDSRVIFEKGWCDNDFPIGNDHRAVHCILGFRLSKVLACKRVKSLKSWRPNLDENGEATEDRNGHPCSSMPGDCPVKQSKSQRLLRSKKERRKKNKK